MAKELKCPKCQRALELDETGKKAICKRCKKEFALEKNWYITAIELAIMLSILFGAQELLGMVIPIRAIVGLISCIFTLLVYVLWNRMLKTLLPLHVIFKIKQ